MVGLKSMVMVTLVILLLIIMLAAVGTYVAWSRRDGASLTQQASSPAGVNPSSRAISVSSSYSLIGFDTKPSIPAVRAASLSASSTLAVSAMIGTGFNWCSCSYWRKIGRASWRERVSIT